MSQQICGQVRDQKQQCMSWSNYIRSVLIIINIISIVPGCLLIYASFKVSNDNHHRDSLNILHQTSSSSSNPILTSSCIIGAGLGSIIVFISLLGFYGSIKRSKSILATYATILSIIVLLLLVMVIFTYKLSYTKNNNNKTAAYMELDKAYVNSTVAMYNYIDATDPKTTTIDHIQRRFSCCGLNSPNDWVEFSNQQIPKSCCSEPVESNMPLYKFCTQSDYKIGCWRPLQDYFQETILPIARDMLLFKIYFYVFCVALACLLIRSIKKDLDIV